MLLKHTRTLIHDDHDVVTVPRGMPNVAKTAAPGIVVFIRLHWPVLLGRQPQLIRVNEMKAGVGMGER